MPLTYLVRAAEYVRDALSRPFVIDGREVCIAASVGTSIGDTASARVLLQRADAAMYQVKEVQIRRSH